MATIPVLLMRPAIGRLIKQILRGIVLWSFWSASLLLLKGQMLNREADQSEWGVQKAALEYARGNISSREYLNIVKRRARESFQVQTSALRKPEGMADGEEE